MRLFLYSYLVKCKLCYMEGPSPPPPRAERKRMTFDPTEKEPGTSWHVSNVLGRHPFTQELRGRHPFTQSDRKRNVE